MILLDHRVTEQISTRRLRIVKYRGSVHGNNEYPFLIDEAGISVLPVTSLGLQHEVSSERVSSGIPRLDTMLAGRGYYRGSSVLVSGTAGSGKTSVAAHFVDAACRRGERAMYFAFEESQGQLIRNMRSIGIDLEPWIKSGLLRFHAARPTLYGLEMHLATIHKLVDDFQPQAVVIDPLSNFTSAGTTTEVKAMLMRLIDFFKSKQITAVFTNLTSGGGPSEQTDVGVSSLMDTWLLLRDIEVGGERNRSMYILKSRGMAHSNQLREFLLTDHGVELVDVYLGPEGVLTGFRPACAGVQGEGRGLGSTAGDRRASSANWIDSARPWNRKSPRCGRSSRPRKNNFPAPSPSSRPGKADRPGPRGDGAQPKIGCRRRYDAAPRPKTPKRRQTMTHEQETTDVASEPAEGEVWQLRLYVAGRTPKSVAAFANLKRICEEHMQGRYHVEVIDLLEQPQLAKGDQILAIPTLVRKLPEPLKRIIGDLSNEERVLVGLDLRPGNPIPDIARTLHSD